MAVSALAAGVEEGWPVEPFADGQVDGSRRRGAMGMVTTVPSLRHAVGAVAKLEAEGVDVGAQCFAD